MIYRREIDGLRAIAVIAVALYHAGIPLFKGGFVGVDVFFVISGFLITRIILSKIDQDKFSYKEFWMNRIRRIFPAALAIYFISTFAFYFVLPPKDLIAFGNSLFYQSFFSSNFYFWRETNYFQEATSYLPLLHTWSLSIEEQFYFFLPFTLLLLKRYLRKQQLVVFILMVTASFAISVYFTSTKPAFSFYLLPARAWEFGIGSILAFVEKKPISIGKIAAEIMTIFGYCLLAYGIVLFDKNTLFPSYNAAIPVFGTALIIFSHNYHETKTGELLKTRLFKWFGDISYSLYLWHWVCLVFLNYITIEQPSTSLKILAVFASIILAKISLETIENPIRLNSNRYHQKFLLVLLFVHIGFSLLAGLVLKYSEGIPSRFGNDFVDLSETGTIYDYSKHCKSNEELICTLGTNEADIFLWGDSHAMAILPGLIEAVEELSRGLKFSITEGCPPLQNFKIENLSPDLIEKCNQRNRLVLEHLNNHHYKKIFIVFRHNIYFNDRPPAEQGFLPTRYVFRDKPVSKELKKINALKLIEDEMKRLKDFMGDRNYSILIQVPVLDINPVRRGIRQQIFGNKIEYKKDLETVKMRSQEFVNILDQNEIPYFDLYSVFCSKNECSPYIENKSMYYDDDHLSILGSSRTKEVLKEQLSR